MAKKVVFLCPKCVLDDRSGAAKEVRNVLYTLAEAGWQAKSLNMTLFDGHNEYPRQRILGEKNNVSSNEGTCLRLFQHDVEHVLYYTRSTVDRNLQIGEARNFYQVAKQFLHDEQPDVILTWGQNQLNRLLINLAGSCCRSLIFHLGNAGYYDCDLFQPFDSIFVATRYFADFYHERLGIRPTVRGSLILEDQFAKPQDVLSTQNPNYRKHGFITFINPSFQKGGTLFARLAAIARQERPDLHFLAVEGRMSKEEWRKTGFDLAHFDNVWWIPNQKDIRSVYSRTSILLFPSFGTEAAGRCLPEAQLGGIPVLAANHSGIPDQLNGGGVLFDIPARCRSNYKNIPTENEVRPWLNVIYQLMDDDQTYREASNVALQAAEKFHPDTMKQRIVQLFEDLPETRGPRTQINVLPPGQRPESASEHIQQERAPCVESVN